MLDFFEGASPVFWFAAIFGSVFFLLRVALLIFGGFGADADAGSHDAGSGADAHDGAASDAAFKLLSLNSITGFIAMFGWAGLAAYIQYTLPFVASLGIATAAGAVVMVLSALLFYLAMKLKSPGEVFALADAVGATAEVYMEIPSGGTGRARFSVNGVKREADAVCDGAALIASFQRVVITRVVDSRTVAVALLGTEKSA
ncbi:MAG: hypothetical protein LBS82_01175 [Spirochaetaceae bacterium]|jgi:hypothetical protein|nr:hypothetical protein [Spirochaetaceae bacterium]